MALKEKGAGYLGFLMRSGDLDSNARRERRFLCCCRTALFFVFFSSQRLAVTANTIRDLCVLCKHRREFCAPWPTARGLQRRGIDFCRKGRNDFDNGTLFRVCLHSRSHETCRRARPKCKGVTHGDIYCPLHQRHTI